MKLLTIDETADATGISRQRLCAAIKSGDLPYFPRGAKRNRMLKLSMTCTLGSTARLTGSVRRCRSPTPPAAASPYTMSPSSSQPQPPPAESRLVPPRLAVSRDTAPADFPPQWPDAPARVSPLFSWVFSTFLGIVKIYQIILENLVDVVDIHDRLIYVRRTKEKGNEMTTVVTLKNGRDFEYGRKYAKKNNAEGERDMTTRELSAAQEVIMRHSEGECLDVARSYGFAGGLISCGPTRDGDMYIHVQSGCYRVSSADFLDRLRSMDRLR